MPAPVATFGALDLIVLVLYLLGVTGLGLWIARGQTTKRDYFLGGRQLSWWVVGFSIVATETSALTFIGVPADSIGTLRLNEAGEYIATPGNITFIQLIVGYIIGRAIIAWKIVPLYYRGDVYTPYQLLKRAFGDSARYVASGLQLVGLVLGQSVRVYVVAIPLTLLVNTRFPEWTVAWSIIVIMVFALIYTSIGGIKAVVWTDMIQYFIFVGGGLFALFYVPTLIKGLNAAPSGAEGWAAVFEVAREHGNLQFFRLGWSLDNSLMQNIRDLFCGGHNLIQGIFPITIGIIFAFGFDQLNVQRVLGCKNQKEGSRAMLFSAALIFPQFLLFLLIGGVLYAYYTLNNWNLGMEPWDPSQAGTPNSSFIFPIFIITHTPPIIKGFLVAGILAAAMSSVSSALSAMGSMITMDFYRPLRGGKTDPKTELKLSRLITVLCGVVFAITAMGFVGIEDIIGLAFTVAGLTAGGILGAFVFGMIVKGGSPWPVVMGIITSFLFMTGLNIIMGGALKPFVTQLLGEFNPLIPAIHWSWHAPIGMTICLLVILATNPLFQKTGGDIAEVHVDED